MRIEDCHFRKNESGDYHLFYGDLTDYEPDELNEYPEEVSRENWTSEMWIDLAQEIIEDANYHNLVDLPYIYFTKLRNSGVEEPELSKQMELITLSIYDAI